MSNLITSAAEIEKAYMYVLANDTFCSGWGESKGKINTCIFPCQTAEEVDIVYDNLGDRREMKYVRATHYKPKLNNRTRTYSLFSKEIAPRYWKHGSFR
jgi:hypothetical protein